MRRINPKFKSLIGSNITADSYKEFVIRKIKLGRKAILKGRVIKNEDLKKEISKW